MSQYPKLNHYVSEIDQVLQEFDKKNPKLSRSQQQEQAKYRRIYQLRDVATQAPAPKKDWEAF